METIEVQQLRAFVLTAKRLSVTEAADKLNRPKSAISKTISQMERRIGVRLFERTSRRMTLTEQGAFVLEKAASILEDLDRLTSDLRGELTSLSGLVRISAPPELGALLAERFIPTLVKEFPQLRLTMSLSYKFEDIFASEADIAVRGGRVRDDRLVARKLGSFRRVLVASPDYLERRSISTVHDLEQCNCLHFEVADKTGAWLLERTRGTGGRRTPAQQTVRVAGNFAAKSFTALLGAARAGVGIAQIPDFLAKAHLGTTQHLVPVLPEWGSPPVPVFVVHRFGGERIARVRKVLDSAIARIPNMLRA